MAGFGPRSDTAHGRGSAPGFRFTLYALAAIALMVLDHRMHWIEHVRFGLQGLTYPVEVALNSPVRAWHSLKDDFTARRQLERENRRLRTQVRDLRIRTLRLAALKRQYAELIGLKKAVPPIATRWLPAGIVDIQLNRLRQRILIDRGTENGVFRNQPVFDDYGIVGQTMQVGPWSADVLLITDPQSDVPVQIERTGLRTIAVGTGAPDTIALPYLPANANVRVGDVLVTSGLGGVFPAGYPVARVTRVRPTDVQPMSRVLAQPFAHLQTDREVMLIWFRPGAPGKPHGPVRTGVRGAQPLPAPARPAPAASAKAAPAISPTQRP